MSTQEQTKIESVFKDLKVVSLEKTTLVIKEVTNESWSDETKATGTYYLEQKGRDKKGITLTKADFKTLKPIIEELQ